MMKNPYLLIGCEQERPGMWRLTWHCVDTAVTSEMTVDETMRNFHRNGWDELVSHPAPWGVYTGIRTVARRTRLGRPVVTADSRPQCHDLMDSDDVRRMARINAEPQPDARPFGRLFSYD